MPKIEAAIGHPSNHEALKPVPTGHASILSFAPLHRTLSSRARSLLGDQQGCFSNHTHAWVSHIACNDFDRSVLDAKRISSHSRLKVVVALWNCSHASLERKKAELIDIQCTSEILCSPCTKPRTLVQHETQGLLSPHYCTHSAKSGSCRCQEVTDGPEVLYCTVPQHRNEEPRIFRHVF